MNIYQKNLQSLQSSNPELASLIESTNIDPDRYSIDNAKSGVITLQYISTDGKPVLWHSRYDPLKEVEREINSIDRSKIILPLLVGIGLGYTLRTLWDHCRDDFFDIIVIEKDPSIFRMALHITRLDDILADPRVHIHVGGQMSNWVNMVDKLTPLILSCTLEKLPHPPSLICHLDYYQSALNDLEHRLHLRKTEFEFTSAQGTKIQQNMWNNIPSIVASSGINSLRGKFKGKPAIVIAAGPSLDKNVHLLKGIEKNFLLIAVDTAYRTLQNHGIEPHIVVSTDPTELNLKHFDGLTPSPETILAFDPEVYHAIPSQWTGPRRFLNLEKTILARWLEISAGPFGFLPKGSSVGHTAFFLAREMGADPIIFIGLDLAFNQDGGATHTAGSALHRKHSSIENNTNTALLGPRHGSQTMNESIAWVAGTHHEVVPTSKVMALYINQFADAISETSAKIIDATEGGARIPGAEVASLQEVLSKYKQYADNIADDLQSLPSFERNTARLLVDIERILNNLDSAIQTAQHGQALTASLLPGISEGANLRNCAEWIEMESCFSQIYQSEDIKIAIEQAMFSAVYSFLFKEKPHQVELRIEKYRKFFETISSLAPHFIKQINHIKSLIQTSI